MVREGGWPSFGGDPEPFTRDKPSACCGPALTQLLNLEVSYKEWIEVARCVFVELAGWFDAVGHTGAAARSLRPSDPGHIQHLNTAKLAAFVFDSVFCRSGGALATAPLNHTHRGTACGCFSTFDCDRCA